MLSESENIEDRELAHRRCACMADFTHINLIIRLSGSVSGVCVVSAVYIYESAAYIAGRQD